MGKLEGRVALVVGAGATGDGIGNGRAIAIAFARHGATVVAMDLDAASAERTADMIRAEGGTCAPAASSATVETAIRSRLPAR